MPSVEERDIEGVALAFDRACRKASVAYAFIGGMAVNAWGQPRATTDVDCLVELPMASDAKLADEVCAEGLAVKEEDIAAARDERSHLTIFDERGPFHVDCKLAATPQENAQVREAVEVPYAGALLRVARPEETVAFKLKFGSPRDLQDARSILLRQGDRIDQKRLRAIAIQLEVTKELDHLLRQR